MDKTDIALDITWMLNDLLETVNTLNEKKAIMRGFNFGMPMGRFLETEDANKLMDSLINAFIDKYCV